MDLKAERDIERGQLSHTDEDNLSQFLQKVETIEDDMKEITNLLFDLQSLNEEIKSTNSDKFLRGLRDRINSDMVAVLSKAKIVKARLEALDRSNLANRNILAVYAEGNAVDRTRMATTHGLRVELMDIMNDFQALRERILSDYKESVKRKYYNATRKFASVELNEKMVLGTEKLQIFEGRTELNMEENKERHEAVMDIQSSLNKLHQVFLDMAVLVETQSEHIDDIEQNVANAGSFISGGTNSLFYATQKKKWYTGSGLLA